MKKRYPAYLKLISFFLLLSFSSTGYSKVSFEIGPSYIVNMSNHVWNNTPGLNIGMNYKLTDKISINPRVSAYKFLAEERWMTEPMIYNTSNYFSFFSLANNEIGFYDLSIGMKIATTTHYINPIFNLRSGIHFLRYTKTNNSDIIIFNEEIYVQSKKVNKTIGFGAAGLGLSFNLSKRINLIVESSFSVSFDYNYIFVPVDLTFRINL
jgi:hypothetical protein